MAMPSGKQEILNSRIYTKNISLSCDIVPLSSSLPFPSSRQLDFRLYARHTDPQVDEGSADNQSGRQSRTTDADHGTVRLGADPAVDRFFLPPNLSQGSVT